MDKKKETKKKTDKGKYVHKTIAYNAICFPTTKLAERQKSKRKIWIKNRGCKEKPDKKRMDKNKGKRKKKGEKWAHLHINCCSSHPEGNLRRETATRRVEESFAPIPKSDDWQLAPISALDVPSPLFTNGLDCNHNDYVNLQKMYSDWASALG